MSAKSHRSIRRTVRKLNKKVFEEFTIEISVMPFLTRLKFCLQMAFCVHGLQKKLKDEIKTRRKYTRDGEEVKG